MGLSGSAQWHCYVIYPLREKQDPVSRLHYFFLTVPPWSLNPLPSLINNCWTCSLELRGHEGWTKPISYNEEMRNTEWLLCPGVPQRPAWFQTMNFTLFLSKTSKKKVRYFINYNMLYRYKSIFFSNVVFWLQKLNWQPNSDLGLFSAWT